MSHLSFSPLTKIVRIQSTAQVITDTPSPNNKKMIKSMLFEMQ